MAYEQMKILAGNGNKIFAESVAHYLGIELTSVDCSYFSNHETKIRINQSIRDCDSFIIQSMVSPKPNDHFIELCFIARTLEESDKVRGITTAVVPFLAYTRQDKKKHGREPISARLIADMLNISGVDRYVFVDLHNPSIEGFFSPKPTSNILAHYLISDELSKREELCDYVILSPDEGALKRNRQIAVDLRLSVGFIDKERSETLEVKTMSVVGDVKNKNVLIIDDIIDTAGTIIAAVNAAKSYGAKDISVCCTHPVLSDPAAERLNKADIKELIITDTIPVSEDKKKRINKPIITLSFVPLIAGVIDVLYHKKSIEDFFKKIEFGIHARLKK